MNDLLVVSVVAFDINQVGFPVSFLFQQGAVGSLLRMEVILLNTSLMLNTLRKKMISWSRTWSISWDLHWRIGKIYCSHNKTAKHKYISCLPRESLLNHSWHLWILPQVIRDIHISPRLSCPWFLAELDYCSKSIDIATCIHPQAPGYKQDCGAV